LTVRSIDPPARQAIRSAPLPAAGRFDRRTRASRLQHGGMRSLLTCAASLAAASFHPLTASALSAAAIDTRVQRDPAEGAIHAVFSPHALSVDGRLDERAWAGAPVFDAFVRNEPTEGGPGTERTELRVLFDRDTLYVGFRNFDSRPHQINRSLGRRDSEPASDHVVVYLSAAGDRRTARRFYLNAGGVQADSLQYDDVLVTQTWDAVWRGAVADFPGGWTAELAIPLYLIGHAGQARARWYFLARRRIARTHETVSSVLIPRASNAFVSRFGALDGVASVAPRRALELLPYLSVRTLVRPQAGDPAMPTPREALAASDLGLDAALVLGRGLTLNATLNPDFGQVEVDEVVLNVTNFETFFPEKRPFFTHGLDLFQPVGGESTAQLHNLFYSRRIGGGAPILGAAKLSGAAGSRLSFGLLDAVVTPERPLHLESSEEAPSSQTTTNYLAAVGRASVADESWVGARFSAATPLGPECTEQDLGADPIPARCALAGGNAFALDANLESPRGDYAIYGQAAVSQAVGGPPSRLLLDGTRLERGDFGVGAYLRAGRYGGEPWRFELAYDGESPDFDVNAVGFQLDQNRHQLVTKAGWFRPGGIGKLHSFDATLIGTASWSADGRALSRERRLKLDINAVTPGFHTLYWENSAMTGGYDLRELRESGVAIERLPVHFTRLTFESDPSQVASARAVAGLGRHGAAGPIPPRYDWILTGGATIRPSAAWETRLDVTVDRTFFDPRFVQESAPGQFLLARLDYSLLSATLRQQWVVTRDFTLQAYVQWFSAYGDYGPFFDGAGTADDPLLHRGLTAAPSPPSSPDFHAAEILVNAIARWEYRPGSTLYLVYLRSQRERPPDSVDSTLGSASLFDGPAEDVVSLKWTWFWSLQ
jgi:Domain of unknown function (DUF5916)